MKPIKLHNWSLSAPADASFYQAPETVVPRLSGNAEGHPRFPNGAFITTTRPVAKLPNPNGYAFVVTKSGSVYELMEPHPDYVKAYPNADGVMRKSVEHLPTHQP